MEPEKEFHVREIARRVTMSPTTVSKRLKLYEKNGILRSEEKLNHLLFMADLSSDSFRYKKIAYNLEKIGSSGLIEFVKDKLDYPEAIVLFGSWAKGENSGKSDLDLMIVSPNKREIDLRKFEKEFGDVQLFILSSGDVEGLKKTNPELVNSFVNGIVLDGSWGLFR